MVDLVIQNCTNEAAHPHPKGENSKIVKIHLNFKKHLFQNQWAKLGSKHDWIMEVLLYIDEDPHLSPRGDDSKIVIIY